MNERFCFTLRALDFRHSRRAEVSRCVSASDIGGLLEQFLHVHLQRRREPLERVQRDVSFAALDGSDVGAVQSGEIRKFILGNASLVPKSAEVSTHIEIQIAAALTGRWHSPNTSSGADYEATD